MSYTLIWARAAWQEFLATQLSNTISVTGLQWTSIYSCELQKQVLIPPSFCTHTCTHTRAPHTHT